MVRDEFVNKVSGLMSKNRRIKDGFQFTLPAANSYPYQWLWDSCFHAIILSHINLSDAKSEIISVISQQFENGMIPHMIYWEQTDNPPFPRINWGKEASSTITQPPLLGYAIWRIYQKDGDKDFLKQVYESAKKFYLYLLKERDPRGNHLLGIINPDESGEDNSPRFDRPLGLDPVHSLDMNFKKRMELINKHLVCNFEVGTCMRNFFWVKDVPFNVIAVESLKCMAVLATELSLIQDTLFFTEQSKLIVEAMRKRMFEDGLFWSTYDFDYKKIKVETWAIFSPLFAQIPSDQEASSLIETYLKNSQKFNLEFTIPTVSKQEPSYDPKGFWRGPVWTATNWFIFKGLIKYGARAEAQAIFKNSLALVEKSGFREYFHPHTGEGMGAYDFTWGGLILDMWEDVHL